MKAIYKYISAHYSKVLTFLFFILSANMTGSLKAQTIYVDAIKGKAGARGSIHDPLISLEEAVNQTNNFSGLEPVVIKLAPGVYTLTHELNIKTALLTQDTIAYTIEAMVMPDDRKWEQSKMPFIKSVSSNSMVVPFPHCIGFLVAKDNVNFKGLKFIGHYNSNVSAYYPIKRGDKTLAGLNVSQCYFIGEKDWAPIEGALWLTGKDIHIDHCVFQSSKTAIILGGTIGGFSLTHSIISGCYESALWYTGSGIFFTFKNNVFTNCQYVLVHPKDKQPDYTFSDSYFVGNVHYLGFYQATKDNQPPVPVPVENSRITEINIHKTGKIKLIPLKSGRIPVNYLSLSSASDGRETAAGIFKLRK